MCHVFKNYGSCFQKLNLYEEVIVFPMKNTYMNNMYVQLIKDESHNDVIEFI